MCGLEDYGDAIVGSLGVEHRKRTTIGVELAAKVSTLVIYPRPTADGGIAQASPVLG
jgi:ATP-binding cassette subfamily G (WHITE) protein 2 (SNQ2)